MENPLNRPKCYLNYGTTKIGKITKYYGQKKVLDEVSFSIKQGEIFSLLGSNGAGKTTLIRIIAEDIANHRHKIGYCPQEGLLYEELTAYENLKFYAMLHHQSINIVRKLMEEFKIPNKNSDLRRRN